MITTTSAGFLGLSVTTKDGTSTINEITHLLELDVSKKTPRWKFVKRPRVGQPSRYPGLYYEDIAVISGVLYLMVEALENEYAKEVIHPNYLVTERIYGSTDDVWKEIRDQLAKYPFVEFVVMAFDGSLLKDYAFELAKFGIRHRLLAEAERVEVDPRKSRASYLLDF